LIGALSHPSQACGCRAARIAERGSEAIAPLVALLNDLKRPIMRAACYLRSTGSMLAKAGRDAIVGSLRTRRLILRPHASGSAAWTRGQGSGARIARA